jgi:hypothetical protein
MAFLENPVDSSSNALVNNHFILNSYYSLLFWQLQLIRIFRLKSTYTRFVALVDISLQFPVVLWI